MRGQVESYGAVRKRHWKASLSGSDGDVSSVTLCAMSTLCSTIKASVAPEDRSSFQQSEEIRRRCHQKAIGIRSTRKELQSLIS